MPLNEYEFPLNKIANVQSQLVRMLHEILVGVVRKRNGHGLEDECCGMVTED